MKVRKLVNRFMDFCREHRKPNTIRSYQSRLRPLVDAMGGRKLASLTMDDVEDYLRRANHWDDGAPKAPDTRRANVVTIQKLFRWAVERQYLEAPIFSVLEKPRGRRRERIPTAEENGAIERLAEPDFRRVFLAMRYCGARPGELAAMQVEQYDRVNRLVVLKEHKTAEATGKPRKIGVGQRLAEVLAEAIGERTTGAVFLDREGRPWTSNRLSKEYKKLARRAGLAEDLCLYLLRHQHATEMCERAGIHATALALGHASLNTTARYVHSDDSLLAKNQDLIHGP